MSSIEVDRAYLLDTLKRLLSIPSPSGYTDNIVHEVGQRLSELGVDFELTRRGAIRATLPGMQSVPDRAVVAHLDTLGAMVSGLKANGRLSVFPVGTWSPRFAEGARVTVFARNGGRRGTLMPLKASGHVYNQEIDTQSVSWDNLEVRVDERVASQVELELLGIRVGDYVAIDPGTEITNSGFVVSRHLDDKAGVAAVLAAIKALRDASSTLPVDAHPLFTVFEEVGSGASAGLHGDVAELVSVDNGTVAPGQNTTEYGVTVAMMDSSGPFDYHLTHKLIGLAEEAGIRFARDVFRHYRSDAASAVEGGNDIRTALICFGLDGSHGYERVHLDSLDALARLIVAYLLSPPTFRRDEANLGPLEGFPEQPRNLKSG